MNENQSLNPDKPIDLVAAYNATRKDADPAVRELQALIVANKDKSAIVTFLTNLQSRADEIKIDTQFLGAGAGGLLGALVPTILESLITQTPPSFKPDMPAVISSTAGYPIGFIVAGLSVGRMRANHAINNGLNRLKRMLTTQQAIQPNITPPGTK